MAVFGMQNCMGCEDQWHPEQHPIMSFSSYYKGYNCSIIGKANGLMKKPSHEFGRTPCHSETFYSGQNDDNRRAYCKYSNRYDECPNSSKHISRKSLIRSSAQCCCETPCPNDEPEPQNYDIDRLMAMVRRPISKNPHMCPSEFPMSECTINDEECDDVFEEQCDRGAKTKLTLSPPRSCVMWCKKAESIESRKAMHMQDMANKLIKPNKPNMPNMPKKDRQVQCQCEIESDFCSCSKSICEFCSKKICCTCTKIRCCLCGKLKSTAERKVYLLDICKCPRRSHCYEILKSYLRFNSSPALWRDHACEKESPSFRPYTTTY